MTPLSAAQAKATAHKGWIRVVRWRGFVLLAVAYFIVASATFHGFYDKWGLREDVPRFAFDAMIEGTADRPFVHRQLLTSSANLIEDALPDAAREAITEGLFGADGALVASDGRLESGASGHIAEDREYTLRYHIVFYMTFASVFVALFAMRAVCVEVGASPLAAFAAPAIFMLSMPIFQTVGGYFYDYAELMFMALALLFAMRGRWLVLAPLTILATLNKESFFFFLPTLLPFALGRWRLLDSGMVVGALVFVSGLTYLAVRTFYAGNPGESAEFHLSANIAFYLDPRNLFGRETTYGLRMLAGYSIVTLTAVGLTAAAGWAGLSRQWKQHVLLALAINLPLFLLFCFPGELRNLSMLAVGFVLLVAKALERMNESGAGRVPSKASNDEALAPTSPQSGPAGLSS